MHWLGKLFHLSGAAFSLALSLLLGLLLCAVLGAGLWLQSDTSLSQALAIAARLLPAGQVLQASAVSGSIKQGGHIGQLRWQKDGLLVEAQELDLSWNWRALLDGQWQLRSLHVRSLRVQDHAPASVTPFTELVLPVHVDLPFVLDHLDYEGSTRLQLDDLRGHYRYDGKQHSLQDGALRMAAGSYQLQANVHTRQPMALSLRASGTVQAPLTVAQQPLQLQAQASAQGTLTGPGAALDVSMAVQPQAGNGKRPLGAMQATLQAHLRPGQPQPRDSARAQWTALDLASLWPQAPRTGLAGQAQLAPDGTGWKGNLQLQNSQSGPLDKQQLPLQTATASVLYRYGQWQLSALQAALAGGTAQAQGSYAGTPLRWQLSAQLQGIHPALLDTRWAGAALDGQLKAQETALGIAFGAGLSAAAGSAPFQQVSAQGLWHAPVLQLDKLLLEGRDAHIAGHLLLNTQSLAASGSLQGQLPGAQLSLEGRASAEAGEGKANAQISDAQALLGWLQALPLVGPSVPAVDAHGAAELALHWSGGWRQLGTELQLQATARAKQIALGTQRLSDLQLELNGTLHALVLQASGKAEMGTQQLALQALSHAGQTGAGRWHARLDSLALQLHDAQQATPWSAQLQQALDIDWEQSGQARSLNLTAGTLQLSGPAPGSAQIQWQPVLWTQGSAPGSAMRWSSKGQLQGVPLAWLELLGQARLANLGLRGDLVFGGQWDASSGNGNGMQVHASVQRTAGDLQLLSAEAGSATLAAGLRDAHATLQIKGEALQASLVWASEAGGNAQADFSTRLQSVDGSPRWAADAPLQATLHASLPRVGLWSLVAPVGWRIHGTMEADASLAGTRSNPLWKGTLDAHDMAIRSVVDGIDFSNGVLRLQFNGQHMDIAELTLQGAGGAGGGTLVASGAVDWLPGAPGSPIASRLRMSLDAKAQALRVTARPDQRLVVSGNLAARLIDERLVLRGVLKADQALFVLPEDTAPKLGADVVVRARRGADKAAPGSPARAPAPTPPKPQSVVLDLNIVLDPGPSFQVQGHGLNTRLSGLVTLQAEGRGATPRLTGELRTVNGTYRAYGQR
ncbi:MAG: translocation/assembly module TamB domain-containing protein, partial [Rhodoferax sp.]|nr:translocation/assembly module TamB domain-containing protein [Rhodoferax sp.]